MLFMTGNTELGNFCCDFAFCGAVLINSNIFSVLCQQIRAGKEGMGRLKGKQVISLLLDQILTLIKPMLSPSLGRKIVMC